MANKDTKKQLGASLLMILAAFIWGTSFVAQSKGLELIDNFTFLSFRSYYAVAALLPVSLVLYKTNRKKGEGEHGEYRQFFSKKLVGGGVLCGIILCIAASLQQYGISLSGVGKSGFLTTLYILLVPLLGLVFFRRRVGKVLWICIGIALVGMYFLCVTDAGGFSLGDVLLIACALGFAVHITVIDRYASRVDGVRLSLIQFFVCAVLSTVCMFLFEKPDMEAVLGAGFSLFYSGVMSSGVAFTLQIVSQKHLNPTVASLLMSLESVFAALSGAVFGERMSGNEILGCCFVFAAIILSQLPIEERLQKKKASRETA